MSTAESRFSKADERSAFANILLGTLMLVWCVVRFPIVVVLTFLEPLVRLILVGIAILSVLTALVFKGTTATPVIPFWGMLCISLVCLLLVPIYHGVLRLLSR